MTTKSHMIYLFLILILFPDNALAREEDFEITLALMERLIWYCFILIVGMEAFFLKHYLPEITKRKAFFVSLKANVLTMLVIAPLTWGICLGIMLCLRYFIFVIWGMYWVVMTALPEFLSQYITTDVVGTILSAPIILYPQYILLAEWVMAPAYFAASYYGEYFFCRKKLSEYKKEDIKKAFFYANLWSYLTIMLLESVYQCFM